MNHLIRFTLLALLVVPLASAKSPAPVAAATLAAPTKVFMKVNEALELAFEGCEVKRDTVYLTDEQKKRAKKLSGKKLESGIIHPYRAYKDGKLVGTAYFDTHRVRTMKETVMIVVDTKNKIKRIELLSFAEPIDYIPSGRWYGQFLGKELNDDLNLKRKIRGVTGATLTARATTDCARRVLALHDVINKKKPKPAKKSPKESPKK